jgi:hypothetical protein
MYCPKCKSEFQSWVSTCPDCNVALAPELPPEPDHEPIEVKTLLETSDPDLLPVLLGALRAAGIPYWTPGESTMDVLPLGPVDGGRVATNLISTAVLVPADRYEEALAIIETPAQVVDAESDEELTPEADEPTEEKNA